MALAQNDKHEIQESIQRTQEAPNATTRPDEIVQDTAKKVAKKVKGLLEDEEIDANESLKTIIDKSYGSLSKKTKETLLFKGPVLSKKNEEKLKEHLNNKGLSIVNDVDFKKFYKNLHEKIEAELFPKDDQAKLLSTKRNPSPRSKNSIIHYFKGKGIDINKVNFEDVYNKLYNYAEARSVYQAPEAERATTNAEFLLKQINQGTNFNDEEKGQIKELLFFRIQGEQNSNIYKSKRYSEGASEAANAILSRLKGRTELMHSLKDAIEEEYRDKGQEVVNSIFSELSIKPEKRSEFLKEVYKELHSDLYSTPVSPIKGEYLDSIYKAIVKIKENHFPLIIFHDLISESNSIKEHIDSKRINTGFMNDTSNYETPDWINNDQENTNN